MLTDLLTLPCTITRRTPSTSDPDEYGNRAPSEATVTTVCELQQRQRAEDDINGQVATAAFLLILPAGTALHTTDTVTIDGDDYEVQGEPWAARNPRTQAASHVEATVTRVTSTNGGA